MKITWSIVTSNLTISCWSMRLLRLLRFKILMWILLTLDCLLFVKEKVLRTLPRLDLSIIWLLKSSKRFILENVMFGGLESLLISCFWETILFILILSKTFGKNCKLMRSVNTLNGKIFKKINNSCLEKCWILTIWVESQWKNWSSTTTSQWEGQVCWDKGTEDKYYLKWKVTIAIKPCLWI